MGKRGKKPNRSMGKKRDTKPAPVETFGEEDMDDEIDDFHKQQDMIPLDADHDAGISDEDIDEPVFDVEVGDDDDDDDDDDGDNDDDDDESELSGLAAKILRQKKYLRAKMGGVEDEMDDEEDEEKEKKDSVWGKSKGLYYNADNIREVQSSDDESAMEEEAEVIRLQKERAKSLQMEDFGLDEEQEISVSPSAVETRSKPVQGEKTKALLDIVENVNDDTEIYKVKKDINSLSKEEQMEVVFSAAPELVGLLSELNDALNQLYGEECPPLKVISSDIRVHGKIALKVKDGKPTGGLNYMEVKHLLLLVYCQAIVFYLLLKSEGHPVREHPVLARLVDVKSLLDKMNKICPSACHDNKETMGNSDGCTQQLNTYAIGSIGELEIQKTDKGNISLLKSQETAKESNEDTVLDLLQPSLTKSETEKIVSLGQESLEMLKVRASLEEKLKKKGIYSSKTSERQTKEKISQPSSRKREAVDDFDDENGVKDATTQKTGLKNTMKLSQLVSVVGKAVKKPKLISGDADLPLRDDIGERRRKHDHRSLGNSESESLEDGAQGHDNAPDIEDDFYKEVKQRRAAKILEKAEKYTRTTTAQSLPEDEATGKRHISYQMETNKGLTRKRKKLTKIPRKKYKLKHQKAVVHRKGQVRDLRRPSGPYGGEATGISTRVSHSVRFRN